MELPFALEKINRVAFYKRDELTTDLICCAILADDQEWTFHEEMAGWDDLVAKLSGLSGFSHDWYSQVSQPPFAAATLVAYERPSGHSVGG